MKFQTRPVNEDVHDLDQVEMRIDGKDEMDFLNLGVVLGSFQLLCHSFDGYQVGGGPVVDG